MMRRDDAPLRKVAGVAGEFDKLRKKLSGTSRNGLRCTCSAAMSRRRPCCASSFLTPCIILFVNVFLMPLPALAGPLLFLSKPPCLKAGILPYWRTGAVGEALLETLAERQFRWGIFCLARNESAGEHLRFAASQIVWRRRRV